MISIIDEIKQERWSQNEKWGIQDHSAIEWIAILTEEVGEAAKEAVNFRFNNPNKRQRISQEEIQKMRMADYRRELIQVAAVAIQAIESLDRQAKPEYKPRKTYTHD